MDDLPRLSLFKQYARVRRPGAPARLSARWGIVELPGLFLQCSPGCDWDENDFAGWKFWMDSAARDNMLAYYDKIDLAEEKVRSQWKQLDRIVGEYAKQENELQAKLGVVVSGEPNNAWMIDEMQQRIRECQEDSHREQGRCRAEIGILEEEKEYFQRLVDETTPLLPTEESRAAYEHFLLQQFPTRRDALQSLQMWLLMNQVAV